MKDSKVKMCCFELELVMTRYRSIEIMATARGLHTCIGISCFDFYYDISNICVLRNFSLVTSSCLFKLWWIIVCV